MKRILSSLLVGLLLAVTAMAWAGDAELAQVYRQQQSNQLLEGEGTVIKLLPDDNQGRRHQRFVLRLASGQTVLIVHNIDLATKIANLQVGDKVSFAGEYEWNNKGGTVHWTHHDPSGRHPAGWLRHGGRIYQ